jgi:hypothetical protein
LLLALGQAIFKELIGPSSCFSPLQSSFTSGEGIARSHELWENFRPNATLIAL